MLVEGQTDPPGIHARAAATSPSFDRRACACELTHMAHVAYDLAGEFDERLCRSRMRYQTATPKRARRHLMSPGPFWVAIRTKSGTSPQKMDTAKKREETLTKRT